MPLDSTVLLCFGLSVASAVFPWMSVEIIVLGLPAIARSREALVVLLFAATAGQMAGKAAVYWIGRGSSRWTTPRMARAVEQWRERFARGSNPAGLVFLSSAIGWPPFFAVTAVAGALKIHFPTFMAAGTAGRLVRFSALIVVPKLIAAWMR